METPVDSLINKAVDDLHIPPQPKLLDRVDVLLRQDEPDIARVANLIAKDVATSASVLRIINSPLYSLQKNIVNIRQAALYLGINGLLTLVKGMLLRQAFLQEHCCLSLGRFWDTADEVARVAITINRELGLLLPQDNLYALGLFHDAGIPAIASTFSDYKQTLMDANRSHCETIIDIENRRYGTNHTNVSYLMAKSWHLPDTLCTIILKHHDHLFWLSQRESTETKLNTVFQLAEYFVQKARRGVVANDWQVAQEYVLPNLNLRQDELAEFQAHVIEVV